MVIKVRCEVPWWPRTSLAFSHDGPAGLGFLTGCVPAVPWVCARERTRARGPAPGCGGGAEASSPEAHPLWGSPRGPLLALPPTSQASRLPGTCPPQAGLVMSGWEEGGLSGCRGRVLRALVLPVRWRTQPFTMVLVCALSPDGLCSFLGVCQGAARVCARTCAVFAHRAAWAVPQFRDWCLSVRLSICA